MHMCLIRIIICLMIIKCGFVNNYGMSNIFENLGLMIQEFDMYDVINLSD